ncbi:hypothetical protein [Streptomyces sp. NPDC058665]|uniref:hypothetical protein n=1 Tax=Streptomyces sp. NPDC058665 TaxID=3346586 RepID=UPI00364A242F
MTAHPLAVPAPDTERVVSAFREQGLRQALAQLRSAGNVHGAASLGAVVLGYRLVWQITDPWIDLAFQRLGNAAPSPAGDTA